MRSISHFAAALACGAIMTGCMVMGVQDMTVKLRDKPMTECTASALVKLKSVASVETKAWVNTLFGVTTNEYIVFYLKTPIQPFDWYRISYPPSKKGPYRVDYETYASSRPTHEQIKENEKQMREVWDYLKMACSNVVVGGNETARYRIVFAPGI